LDWLNQGKDVRKGTWGPKEARLFLYFFCSTHSAFLMTKGHKA